jgi:beta-N-acetylhexosaminidase
MIDLRGKTLAADERQWLQSPLVGGVILFTRNFESVEQLRRLVAEVHAVRQPALLVTVDQEGGRVQRFREPFFRLPPFSALGRLYDGSETSPCERRVRSAGSWRRSCAAWAST